jgi:hypothetical protein
MQNIPTQYGHIKGWGIDADDNNEPTYPMKKYTGDDHNRLNYERAEPQEPDVEVLKSNERPQLPAVFGTSVPPSGLSGVVRRKAFRFSEGQYMHWMLLVLADRINVIEGLLTDISKGVLPNIPKEKGWKSEWQHNRTEFTTKLITTTAVICGVVWIMMSRRKFKKRTVFRLW